MRRKIIVGDPLLLDGVTANTNGTDVEWPGGKGTVAVHSTNFGGGTVTLQWSPNNGTNWYTVENLAGTGIALTATGYENFEVAEGSLRATLTGATTPAATTAHLRRYDVL